MNLLFLNSSLNGWRLSLSLGLQQLSPKESENGWTSIWGPQIYWQILNFLTNSNDEVVQLKLLQDLSDLLKSSTESNESKGLTEWSNLDRLSWGKGI